MHRIVYLFCAGIIAYGLSILLTACGGGECDKSCDDVAAQAHGVETVQPVNCAASGSCS